VDTEVVVVGLDIVIVVVPVTVGVAEVSVVGATEMVRLVEVVVGVVDPDTVLPASTTGSRTTSLCLTGMGVVVIVVGATRFPCKVGPLAGGKG
jgi:hypothetical protein